MGVTVIPKPAILTSAVATKIHIDADIGTIYIHAHQRVTI